MHTRTTIEILTVPGCSSRKPTKNMIDMLLKKNGLQGITVKDVIIETPDQAVQQQFPGSPTVRINGLDVEPAAREQTDFGTG
jgi:hypothetical protein